MQASSAPLPTPTHAELRRFGLSTGAVTAVLFGVLLPWLWGRGWPLWPWGLGGLLVGVALVCPGCLRPVYRAWMGLAHVLGWINTRLILGLMFFVILAPIGILMRLLGWDAMRRRQHRAEPSYRTPSKQPNPGNMERPF